MDRRYDRLITIQRKTVTQSDSGAEIETWTDLAHRIPAGVLPTRGTERFTNSQEVAQQEVTFTIRYHAIPAASRPLLPEDRIIYPADDLDAETQMPPANTVYDVVSPDVFGRNVDWSIKTLRRADITS